MLYYKQINGEDSVGCLKYYEVSLLEDAVLHAIYFVFVESLIGGGEKSL